MEFKDRFREAIQKRGLTQKQAAELIGCNEHMLGNYMRGSQPRLPMYERILAAFPELRDGQAVA